MKLLISNIFQKLYYTVDTMIVGNSLGDKSLAAMGACMAIDELMVGFALGIGNGLSIVIAKIYGMNDKKQLRESIASTLIIGIGVTTVFMIISRICLYSLLRLLRTPTEIIGESYSYIGTTTLFIGVMFAYNMLAGILRAIGNSMMPFVFLLFSSVLNVTFDFLFILQFHMGVKGAAVASVAAQGISAILCLIYIIRKNPELIPHREDFVWNRQMYDDLIGQGMSMGFMLAIVSIATVILQCTINSFGYLIIAGHAAARKLNSFFLAPMTSIALATSTFVSQNRGANQRNRIKKIVKYVNLLCLAWGGIVTIFIHYMAPAMIAFVSGSKEAVLISNGARYLICNSPFYAIFGILATLRYSLQGIGRKVVPLVSSIIELVGKILFVVFLIPYFKYFGVIICEPIIWGVMCSQLAFSFYHDRYIRGLDNGKVIG